MPSNDMPRGLQNFFLICASAAFLLPSGCATSRARWPVKLDSRPAVSIETFKDHSGFRGKWKPGEDMARLAADALRKTDRVEVHVPEVRAGVEKILDQGKNLLLKDGASDSCAQYVISGSVTEFSVAGDSSGWFAVSRARPGRAQVEIELVVSDSKSGSVLSSFRAKGAASTPRRHADISYKSMTFGGKAFSDSPLGRAAEQALRRGVKGILRGIPAEYWQPRIAEAGTDTVIINGGENARVRKYDEFIVREESREITDPVSGRVIETIAGRQTGRIRVTQVNRASAHARILEGFVRRGQVLEPVRREKK
ncbi:MAG TPA: CsgG/HfaB family protein [Kiritimatiellia bacterium]|nr:CsgG/HfaB family protein [Kiritimatiellia bacterium]